MPGVDILSLLVFAVITAITPGPNNLVLPGFLWLGDRMPGGAGKPTPPGTKAITGP